MKLFAGIDGGQSSTTALVADASGKILGTGHAGPADEVGQDAHSTRLHDAFHLALSHALRAAHAFPDTAFAAVVAGLSGYNGSVIGTAPKIKSDIFEMVHDTRIAHAAAFGGGEGVLVIAGTGSVAFGVDAEGAECRIGGWGYLFGDQGSAFWIGRRLIERAMSDQDLGLPSTVRKRVLAYFEAQELADISDAFYGGRIDRAKIAALASVAADLAHDGIDDARLIIEQSADACAVLAALCTRRLHGNKRITAGDLPVSFSGGLMRDAAFAERVYARVHVRLAQSRIVRSDATPAVGALMLAYRAAGLEPLPRVQR